MGGLCRNAAVLMLALGLDASGAGAPPLMQLAATLPLPGVGGRIDHLAVDVRRHRVYVAALGHDTVEVIDEDAGRHRSIAGFRGPQGIAYVRGANRLFVANGEGDRVDVLDASSLAVLGRTGGLGDADNLRYDRASHAVLAGYGAGGLAILGATKGELRARIPLPGHPESFQAERDGRRVFVNVPSARKVVVVDTDSRRTIAAWEVPGARGNFPMALDEENHRLFVGARFPAVMLVYDTDSGKVVARIPIGQDVDDLFFDARRKRVYAICGEGRVDVVRQVAAGRYARDAPIETAPGARTGLFVPEEQMLLVAAPASGGHPARILAYRLR